VGEVGEVGGGGREGPRLCHHHPVQTPVQENPHPSRVEPAKFHGGRQKNTREPWACRKSRERERGGLNQGRSWAGCAGRFLSVSSFQTSRRIPNVDCAIARASFNLSSRDSVGIFTSRVGKHPFCRGRRSCFCVHGANTSLL
jgi:hypothetical protein